MGFAFVIGQLGAGLGPSDVVIDLSPLSHVVAVPAADLDPLPPAVLSVCPLGSI